MQKLFENWRDFRKNILSEATPDIIDYSPELHTRIKPADSLTVKELSIARQVLSFVFPPLAIPEAVESYEQFDKNPSLVNAGYAALAMLATLPFIAYPAKALKAGVAVNAVTKAEKLKTAKQVVSSAEKTSKAMKGAPEYQQLASKIDDAIIKGKKEIEVLESLSHYMHTAQGFSKLNTEKLDLLLKMARGGKAVGYSGEAYRGARANDVFHLVDQLNIPGIAKRDRLDYSKVQAGRATVDDITNQADIYFRRQLQKVYDKPGEWVEIRLPSKQVTLNTRDAGAASFTKNWKSAEQFADTSVYANKSDKFEIIFQSSGDNFVDAAKTLDKHGIKVADDLRGEEEVLAIGEAVIEKIFVRRLQ